jgi:DNA topoisomerase VI subunit B
MPSSNSNFERRTFTTSRLAEFCSVKELTTQTGFGPAHWPLVVLKELVDNALDAAEQAGVAPIINVEVTCNGEIIVVDETGPGIAPDTVQRMIDYNTRTSHLPRPRLRRSRQRYTGPRFR